ncbi:hypothetical protein Tco_1530452 [Tanacetum coccineum]
MAYREEDRFSIRKEFQQYSLACLNYRMYGNDCPFEDANLKFLRSLPSGIKGSTLKTISTAATSTYPKMIILKTSQTAMGNCSQLLLAKLLKMYGYEIDIRWQVAMITARIRMLYREDRKSEANGRNEKRIVAIEDSNSKRRGGNRQTMKILYWSNGKLFDAEQWALGDFDWSNKDDDTTSILAFNGTNSEETRNKLSDFKSLRRKHNVSSLDKECLIYLQSLSLLMKTVILRAPRKNDVLQPGSKEYYLPLEESLSWLQNATEDEAVLSTPTPHTVFVISLLGKMCYELLSSTMHESLMSHVQVACLDPLGEFVKFLGIIFGSLS